MATSDRRRRRSGSRVSVPLRGFSEWRHLMMATGMELILQVSVPLRGFSEWRLHLFRFRLILL